MSKDDFWLWFGQNKNALEDFLSQGTNDYTIYESLSEKLKQFNEFLIPELTLDNEGHFILIISCDGMKQGIPFVEKLTQGIQRYSNWVIVKYRQAGPMKVIPLDGLNLKRKDIYLTWTWEIQYSFLYLHSSIIPVNQPVNYIRAFRYLRLDPTNHSARKASTGLR